MSYQYTEEDIQKVINYLKIHHPERATREGAIALLEEMKVASKDIAKALEELAKESEKKIPSN